MPHHVENILQEIAENALPPRVTEDVPDGFVLNKFTRWQNKNQMDSTKYLGTLASTILSDPMHQNVPRSPCRNERRHLGLEQIPY